jgi:hypothetical protein
MLDPQFSRTQPNAGHDVFPRDALGFDSKPDFCAPEIPAR